MKNSRFLSLAIMVAAASAFSCTREVAEHAALQEDGLEEMTFEASSALSSKTSLTADKYIVWTASDRLSVFDGWHNRCFATADSGSTAVFKGYAKPSAVHYAVYPYNETFEMTAPGVFSASVPVSQSVSDGSFGEGANLAVGKADGGVFHMMNACGYVRLDITGCTRKLSSVTIDAGEGNFISGDVEIDFTSGTPSLSATKGERRVVLHPTSGNSLGNGTYYAAAVPGKCSDSISVKAISDEGYIASVKVGGIDIVRNTDKGSRIAIDFSQVSWASPVTNEFYIRFINAETEKLIQPFTPDIERNSSGVVTTPAFGEYQLKDYPGYNFFLNLSTSCRFNSSSGFNFGNTGDYITFPELAGKSLKRVDIRFYTAGGDQMVSLRDEDGVIRGGEPKATPCAALDTVSFIPENPVTGVGYTLYKESSATDRIHFIRLVYSGLDIMQVSAVSLEPSEILGGRLDVTGGISVINPDAGYLTWGIEYFEEKGRTWTQFANGSGQSISGTLEGIASDTLAVRAWAKADDNDKVYSKEMEYVWIHPSVESINVKTTKIEDCRITVSAEVLGSDFDKGTVSWGIDYRTDTTGTWLVGPCGTGSVIDTVFNVPADSADVRIWARGDDKAVVYSDVVFVKMVPVNVRSVSVTKATLRRGTLRFTGEVDAENPTAGDLNWGLQYRAPGASVWTDGPTGIGASIADSLTGVSLKEVVVRLWASADGRPAVVSDTLKALGPKTVVIEFSTDGIEYVKTWGLGEQGDSVGVDSTFPLPLPTSTDKRSTVRPKPYSGSKSPSGTQAWDEFNIRNCSLPFRIEGSVSSAQGRTSATYYMTSSKGLYINSSVLTIPAVEGYVFTGMEFYSTKAVKYVVGTRHTGTSPSVTDNTNRLVSTAGGVTVCTEDDFVGTKPVAGTQYYLWILASVEIRNLTYHYEVCE